MPRTVRWFLILSYGALVAGAILAIVRFLEPGALTPRGGFGFVIETQAISFGLPVLLVSLAGLGRQNWARWVILVLFVIELFILVPTFALLRGGAPVDVLIAMAQTVVQAIALALVFSRSASAWYRREAPPG